MSSHVPGETTHGFCLIAKVGAGRSLLHEAQYRQVSGCGSSRNCVSVGRMRTRGFQNRRRQSQRRRHREDQRENGHGEFGWDRHEEGNSEDNRTPKAVGWRLNAPDRAARAVRLAHELRSRWLGKENRVDSFGMALLSTSSKGID